MSEFQSVLLLDNYNLRYGVPTKVTANQYRKVILGDGKGMCYGNLINGEYYLRLRANRFKSLVEMLLNTEE